ncbi:MAG: 2-dehydropantoate 2-reductase [Candidatus Bathyarchaeota archaeon]|nr:MAG: 2-dehydropantoate 2-reductase [Candidatus Bathyarchaeota archaeon]
MKKPIVAIVGMGPVGSVLAAHLVRNGEDVVAVDILEEILHKMRKEGLRISGITKLTARINKTANSISQLAEYNPEIVFLATKASVLKHILPSFKKIYASDMKIVSYQNGLDNERIIAESLGVDITYRAVINYAGNLAGPGNVSMNWFQPPNYIGVLHKGGYATDETTRYIARAMTKSGLETEEASNIKEHVWKKTILNSALCSLCAVTRQTMKEAMEHTHSRDLAMRLVEEGLKVAKADGYDFGPNAPSEFMSYLEKGGAHKPSMLIDVEKKRATEVDFMSGAVARYGAKYQIPTPVNSTFTNLLKTIENQYLTT